MHRVRKLRNKFAHSINLTTEERKQFVKKLYFELVYIEEGHMKHEQFTWKDIALRAGDIISLIEPIEILLAKLYKIDLKKLKLLTTPKSSSSQDDTQQDSESS